MRLQEAEEQIPEIEEKKPTHRLYGKQSLQIEERDLTG